MISRIIYNSPIISGQLVKFTLDRLGSILVINKDQSDTPFEFELLGLRRGIDESESIESYSDDDFVVLKPATLFTPDLNNAALEKGHYALRALTDGIYSIIISETPTDEPEPVDPIQAGLDKVLTQYRESPHLLGVIAAYLRQVEECKTAIREIPPKFNLDIAVGDQLTILGKWLGFPRCHNVTTAIPIFGFKCDGVATSFNIQGFCQGTTWSSCPGAASFEVCINDDELYRRFLYVRRYQLLGHNDYRSFLFCLRILFGADASYVQGGNNNAG